MAAGKHIPAFTFLCKESIKQEESIYNYKQSFAAKTMNYHIRWGNFPSWFKYIQN